MPPGRVVCCSRSPSKFSLTSIPNKSTYRIKSFSFFIIKIIRRFKNYPKINKYIKI